MTPGSVARHRRAAPARRSRTPRLAEPRLADARTAQTASARRASRPAPQAACVGRPAHHATAPWFATEPLARTAYPSAVPAPTAWSVRLDPSASAERARRRALPSAPAIPTRAVLRTTSAPKTGSVGRPRRWARVCRSRIARGVGFAHKSGCITTVLEIATRLDVRAAPATVRAYSRAPKRTPASRRQVESRPAGVARSVRISARRGSIVSQLRLAGTERASLQEAWADSAGRVRAPRRVTAGWTVTGSRSPRWGRS